MLSNTSYIVDDFISSGDTIDSITDAMENFNVEAKLVAIFTYNMSIARYQVETFNGVPVFTAMDVTQES